MLTSDPKHTIHLEVEINPGEYREDEFWVTYEVEPYVPGKLSGPPENCYPPEGGVAMGYEVERINGETGEVSEITWEQFLDLWASSHDLKNDEEETLNHLRRTAPQKAEDQINEELYQAWEEEMACRDEDALDSKADRQNEF